MTNAIGPGDWVVHKGRSSNPTTSGRGCALPDSRFRAVGPGRMQRLWRFNVPRP